MSKIAFLFPGQGSQYPGMGRDLADNFTTARQVFDEADRALGFPLSKLCFEGPAEELQLTANTQPAILAVSSAAAAVLSEKGVTPAYVAGHSLGEYSALVAAGSLGLAEAVRLVRKRGQYMQEAVPPGVGAMAALLGMEPAAVDAVCAEAAQGEVVSAANLNSPGQIVIAGHASAVQRAVDLARTRGAKRAILLNVSAPFHCALMKPAADRLALDLDAARILAPAFPLVNNAGAQPVRSADAVRDGLKRQVTAPVRWTESMNELLAEGVDLLVEVGPGKVLSGLMRQINREARTFHVEDSASLSEALAAMAAIG
ncbi:MAG TPA: ACP S-malonyltransferase [Terriglobia bacterium]|jgi:[acyl-carrier-protein] S-malonyltransferase|nr:ACP S-malonyltransferase [Terriglobia bacterium]